ncbi:M48 family metallopeptidase [Candidatus Cyanaurora vandensis]|uniref:M48 family metallopeptidase n=1 Tax=Candidatus Cyanaurora vandensis TaxID=2714958 RepID=UPI002580BEBC|nr:M48 family metallopeptidase [Candidatus Cyanaurora vandensis]
MTKSTFPGLKATSFRHPQDTQASQTLALIPGLEFLIRHTLAPLAGQFFYLDNISSGILVGPNQLPHIYALHQEACQVLGVNEPQLYIRQNPVPNAYTFAVDGERSFIVLHTSLLELLTPEEVQGVIAHELGHIKCEHSVYVTIANLLLLAARQVPNLGPMVEQPLRLMLFEWLRAAELSCDRAALLVTGQVETVVAMMMKLSGGSPQLIPHLNIEAFVDQVHAYEEFSKEGMPQWLRMAQTAERSHPVPILRAKEIKAWAESPEYRQLVETAV